MDNKYINIYNNLVNLTRNKDLYKKFEKQDIFSERLTILLLHFALFLKIYKIDNDKNILLDIYDYIFSQLELSIREIGYGDQSINKKTKHHNNPFYAMIDKIDNWENLSIELRKIALSKFTDKQSDLDYLAIYFEKYRKNLINNPLNSYLKGVIKS